MLKFKRLILAAIKFQDQRTTLVSSVHIIRRTCSSVVSSDEFLDKMSGKSMPKWIQPEGNGELKLYNSLTREKVRIFPFVASLLLIFRYMNNPCLIIKIWCNYFCDGISQSQLDTSFTNYVLVKESHYC